MSRAAAPTAATTRAGRAKPASSARKPAKPSPATSGPAKHALETNLKYYQFLTRVQSMLITDTVAEPTLKRASMILRPVDFSEVVSERVANHDCGWPACSHTVIDTRAHAGGRFKLHLSQHRVLDASVDALYCSDRCQALAIDYEAKLTNDPVYLRNFDDIVNQQRQSGPPLSQSSSQSLAIAEKAASVSTMFADTSTGINSKPAHTSTPALSTNTNSITALASKKKTRVGFADAVPQPSSTSVDNDEQVDNLMHVALHEKAKAQQTMNPVEGSSIIDASDNDSDSEDDTAPLQSALETRANFATLTAPSSLFAALLHFGIHASSEWTRAYCHGQSVPAVQLTPSLDDTERPRQESLLAIVHQYNHSVGAKLGYSRATVRLIEGELDSMALTMVYSEPVPSLASAQWTIFVLAMIQCGAARRKLKQEAEWEWNASAVRKLVESQGFTWQQFEAIVDALVPFDSSPIGTDTNIATVTDVLSLPWELFTTSLSYLDYDDLALCSTLSRTLHQHCLTLAQHAYDVHLSHRHHQSAQRKLKSLGYMEGLDAGREVLMQRGFDDGVGVGIVNGWSDGYQKGLIAALALLTHDPHTHTGSDSGNDSGGVDCAEIARRCNAVNAAIMHIPFTDSSSQRISIESDDNDSAQSMSDIEYCASVFRSLGVDPANVAQSQLHPKKRDEEPEAAVAERVDAMIAAILASRQ